MLCQWINQVIFTEPSSEFDSVSLFVSHTGLFISRLSAMIFLWGFGCKTVGLFFFLQESTVYACIWMSHLDLKELSFSAWGLICNKTCSEMVLTQLCCLFIWDLISWALIMGTLWCTLTIFNILIGLILDEFSVKP